MSDSGYGHRPNVKIMDTGSTSNDSVLKREGKCARCGGKGYKLERQFWDGRESFVSVLCPVCSGSGK
jgi:DnaJ-class molecular chaperone